MTAAALRQVALTTAVVLSAGAAAAIVRVVPTEAYPTIQSAVDAANPGDDIEIRPGVYFENVHIPSGLTDLEVRGNCAGDETDVIIDGGPNVMEVEGAGACIRTEADRTTIRCLTVRHGSYGIHASAFLERAPGVISDLVVRRVHGRSYNSGQTAGVFVRGPRFRIIDSLFRGQRRFGINATGNGGAIVRTNVSQVGGGCFRVRMSNGHIVDSSAKLCADDGEGFDIAGSDNVISRNSSEYIADDGFQVNGSRNRLAHNSVLSYGDEGFDVTGEDNIIEFNEARRGFDDEAYEINGPRAIVRHNVAADTGADECFEVRGRDPQVTDNTGSNCEGFEVNGLNPVVSNNQVTHHGEQDGFDVSCFVGDASPMICLDGVGELHDYLGCETDEECQLELDEQATCVENPDFCGGTDCCADGEVNDNVAEGGNEDDCGFDVDVSREQTGFEVMRNSSTDAIEHAFCLDMDGAVIADNVGTGFGSDGEDGLHLDGDDNLVKDNVMSAGGGDGFAFYGSGNTLMGNQAVGNLEDGFHVCPGEGVSCIDNRLEANIARRNLGEGIENDGSDTDLVGNRSLFNRIDCANGGTIDVNVGNVCNDGSAFAEDGEIDHHDF